MTKKVTTTLLLLLLILATNAWAAKPTPPPAPKDTLTVTAGTASDGSEPVLKGNTSTSPKEYFYVLCSPLDTPVHITLPLTYVVANTDGVAGNSYPVTAGAVGQISSYVSVSPSPASVSDDGTPVNATVTIDGAALPAGDYHFNVQVSATPSNAISIEHATLHVVLSVNASCSRTLGSKCMLTSSEYVPLQDCSGNFVTDNTGGTFLIVTNNKGTIVSTNPGQFYYNMMWTNDTGTDQDVTFNLEAYQNLVNSGAQSVHAMTFSPTQVQNATDESDFFFATIDSGTPCGPYAAGGCTVHVPDGYMLWVTWHSQFSLIGTNGRAYTNACSVVSDGTHPLISAEGVLTWADGNLDCTASAVGFSSK